MDVAQFDICTETLRDLSVKLSWQRNDIEQNWMVLPVQPGIRYLKMVRTNSEEKTPLKRLK